MTSKSREKIAIDPAREERIDYEIVVDAYDEYERSEGWYAYLDDTLTFPFRAKVIQELGRSPLQNDEIVTVLNMANMEDCESSMYVEVDWKGRTFAAPLEQLYPIEGDEKTIEAVEDWHYWIGREYCF